MAEWWRILLPMQETWVWSLGQKIPWRRKRQSTPVSLPGKSHGQRSPADYSPCHCKRVRHNLATKTRTLSQSSSQWKTGDLNWWGWPCIKLYSLSVLMLWKQNLRIMKWYLVLCYFSFCMKFLFLSFLCEQDFHRITFRYLYINFMVGILTSDTFGQVSQKSEC